MTTRVGVLGLGRMGHPIARALGRAPFALSGFDVVDTRRDRAAGDGVSIASSALDLVADIDILVTVLPGSDELRGALLDDGLLATLAPGSLWLDLGSTDPDVVERIATVAALGDVAVVAAPMAGGPASIASASVSFFVGGETTAVDRALPVLEALGGRGSVDHVGENVRSGGTAKLLSNLLWFGQVVAVTEALLLGASLGIPPVVLRRTLATSAGGSVFIDEYLDSLLAGDYLETFGIDRCVEELDALARLAKRTGVPFELGNLVARLHREALDRFGAIDGELLAAKLLEQRSGIELRA